MGVRSGDKRSVTGKRAPDGARQHATAGPYSPVLEVDARHLVVISGQAALNLDGDVVGESIEEQARVTLENCARQLAAAECTLEDVFKANIYLSDLTNWSRFNTVYEEMLPRPLPVRTAIQAVLLPGFMVEIEMWAAKPHP
jgi:2-iminobutanoate/2-iminopropanoate deaminase